MRLPVKTKVKQISKSELFRAYKSKEVLAYCQHCSNYGKNHSCPDFSFNAVEYLTDYSHAMVILTEIDTSPIKILMGTTDPALFQSKVLSNYMTDLNQDVDSFSRVSMFAFDAIKDQVAEELIVLEGLIPGSLSLPPGSCTRCTPCVKAINRPCQQPEKLRYSLEALGFLVSEIYREHFGRELAWAAGDLPDHFCTCSVLMSHQPLDEVHIKNHLAHKALELCVDE